ncbi:AraC family transcriptional regulator [Amycolatopsis nivea]|uniref:AraC family transcriptional regulator n=1 Tax=Amycolatopsis nivea TaxID=1644109 RepID=UPI0010702B50|nr:AraC family transcriptional regulator [Amycolatopsis nivea]
MTATPNRPLPRTSPRWATDVVRTADRDEAQREISEVFSTHTLEVAGPGADLDVALRARRTEDLTIADIRHGTEVVVRPGRLHSYYEINVPLRGHTLSQCGPDEIESGPGRAAVLTPTEESSMRWSADCAQLAVKVSRQVVERTVEGVLGCPPDEAVHFSIGFDLADGPGRNWLRAVMLLRDAVDSDAPDLVLRPLEELVVGQLLAAQPNNFSDRLLRGAARPARPRLLSRVVDVIDADPAAAHTVSDLARVAGTSVRSLQAAFAEHLGLTPMEYLRRVRLSRAHEDLQNAEPGDGLSVADIAFRWGFGHVPRFAAAYRERYGQLPSQTLRD